MNFFRKAIFERTQELLSALAGGVHWNLYLPRGGTWQDYVVMTPVTASVDNEDTGPETIETRVVRFQIFTNGLESSGENTEVLYKGFRRFSTVLDDGDRIIDCFKDAEDCYLDPDRWSDGSEIWISALQLAFNVQRSIPTAA